MVGGSEWIRVRASGKVNLALRVGGARPDGYHSLGTVFQAVSIHDELGARGAEPEEIGDAIAVGVERDDRARVLRGDAALGRRV